jgi:hypothetical protein
MTVSLYELPLLHVLQVEFQFERIKIKNQIEILKMKITEGACSRWSSWRAGAKSIPALGET